MQWKSNPRKKRTKDDDPVGDFLQEMEPSPRRRDRESSPSSFSFRPDSSGCTRKVTKSRKRKSTNQSKYLEVNNCASVI